MKKNKKLNIFIYILVGIFIISLLSFVFIKKDKNDDVFNNDSKLKIYESIVSFEENSLTLDILEGKVFLSERVDDVYIQILGYGGCYLDFTQTFDGTGRNVLTIIPCNNILDLKFDSVVTLSVVLNVEYDGTLCPFYADDISIYATVSELILDFEGIIPEGQTSYNMDNGATVNSSGINIGNWNRTIYGQVVELVNDTPYMHLFKEDSTSSNFYFDGSDLQLGKYNVTFDLIKSSNWENDVSFLRFAFLRQKDESNQTNYWYEINNGLLQGADITDLINAAPTGETSITTTIYLPVNMSSVQLQFSSIHDNNELWIKSISFSIVE